MVFDEQQLPEAARAAGARDIAIVGLPYHTASQGAEFGVGRKVRVIPEPSNPVDKRAIAICSLDGRRVAGYIPSDDLDRIWTTTPFPREGVIVWENFTWRPRTRIGLRAVIGPSVDLVPVAPRDRSREAARREAAYAAAQQVADQRREQLRLEREAERERQRAALVEARQAERAERERLKAEAKAAKLELTDQRRAAGVCVQCGGPIEPAAGRGRPSLRCATCRPS